MLKRFFKPKNINLDGVSFSVKYTVRKNMRRMLLRIVKKDEIRISLAKSLFMNIEAFILEHKEWILEQNRKIREPFEKDSLFYFRAKAYKVSHHDKALSLLDARIYLHPQRAKKQTDHFYKKEAKEYLPRRLDFFALKMDLEYKDLKFYCSRRKWGSCNSKKVITLSPYMMKLNDEMIDYILVHELAHLKHMNHSKDFYTYVKEFIPEYKRIQKEINLLSSRF